MILTCRNVLAPLLVLLCLSAFGSTPTAAAQQTTSTSLLVTSACLTEGCISTLTATVSANGSPVHPGLVVFCDKGPSNCENEAPIGKAQLLSNGTATIKLALGQGPRTVRAIFHGTKTYAGSISSTQTVTISSLATQKVNSAQVVGYPANGGWTFDGLVHSIGTPFPTGPVSIVDTSRNNQVVAEAPVNASQVFLGYDGGPLDLSAVPASLQTTAAATATGDFNNDGFQDVVQISAANELTVLLGNGSGGFTPAPAYADNAGGNGPLLVADFNGDGHLDVAIADYSANKVHIALGNGNGTFTFATPVSLNVGPYQFAVGDFNNDGIPDIATNNIVAPEGSNIIVLLGAGDGTFTAGTPISFNNDELGSLVVADFNKDGNQDIAVFDAWVGNTTIVSGKGDGTFNPTPILVKQYGLLAAGDFDGDGIPDLMAASANSFVLLHGNGDFTFTAGTPQQIPFAQSVLQLFTGDFAGDGKLQLGTYSTSTGIYGLYLETFEATPTGFTVGGSAATSTSSPSIAMADFDGDGLPDILAFNTGEPAPPNTPPSTFKAKLTINSDARTYNQVYFDAGIHNLIVSYAGDAYHNPSQSTLYPINGATLQYGGGFSNPAGLSLNGSAAINGSTIQLTDGRPNEAGSFFTSQRLSAASFYSSFEFQLTNAAADGFAFVVQANGPDAIGSNGGGVGYGNPPGTTGAGITNSFAVVFDLHQNQNEGSNSVRLEINGVTSGAGAVDLTPSGINLHSGHKFQVAVDDQTPSKVFVTIVDEQTNATFSQALPLPNQATYLSLLNGSSAYMGFTGGTGSQTAAITIDNWSVNSTSLSQPYTTPPFANGFAGTTQIASNGVAAVSGSSLQLTNNSTFKSTSAYFIPKLAPQSGFYTDFDFQVANGVGDGFTFVLQDGHISAVGSQGGGLGYGPLLPTIPSTSSNSVGDSVAIKFDLHNDAGEGVNSTGIYFNGESPTTPAIDLTPSGINLHSGHTFHAHIGTIANGLRLTITDLNVYHVFSVDLPAGTTPQTLIPSPAFAGFTAGTGATPSAISVLNWGWTTN